MTTHLFLGPTLPAERALAALPDAVLHPPVRHLDVLRLDLEPGDTVAVVDGLFFQTAAVRHKELLWLLDHGIAVVGSSSMGALRAAELAPYGMRGIGQVFAGFASGRYDSDDEVAVAHGDEDLGWRQFSDPLVNIRAAAHRAHQAGVLTELQQHAIVCEARQTFFPRRRLTRIVGSCRAQGTLDGPAAERMLAWAAREPWDAKAEDAVQLLEALARRGWLVRQRDGDDLPIEGYPPLMSQWLAKTRPIRVGGQTTTDWYVESLLRLFAQDTVASVYREGIRALAAGGGDDRAQGAEAEAAAEALCLARGVTADDGPAAESLGRYLDGDERATLPPQRQRLLMAARVAVGSLPAPPAPEPRFRDHPAAAVAVDVMRFNAELARKGAKYRPSHIAEATIDRYFTEAWKADDDLETQVRRRGFRDIHHFRSCARHFLAFAIARGVPDVSWDQEATS